MEERKYSIEMYTPIGVRPGVMFATRKEDRITGTIEILERVDSFEGVIEKDGNCKIKGKIISLMKTIEYLATGRITDESISLKLHSGQHTFTISGVAFEKEGE